jgi:valyl-tRNA synthetase
MPFAVYITSQDASESGMLGSQTSTVSALIKGCTLAQLLQNASEVPEGCGSQVLSSSLTVHILVKVGRSITLPSSEHLTETGNG